MTLYGIVVFLFFSRRVVINSEDGSFSWSSNTKEKESNSRFPSSNDGSPVGIQHKRNMFKTSPPIEPLASNVFGERRKSNRDSLLTVSQMTSNDQMKFEDRMKQWRQQQAIKIHQKHHFSYFYGLNR